MIKRNTRFFSTGLFITQLWYAFDLSQYRKSTKTQNRLSTPPLPIHDSDTSHPTQQTAESKTNPSTPTPANATNVSIAYSPHPFAHLCAVLQPAYLEAFDLDSVRIRSAFCSASNVLSLPPTPATTTSISPDVLASYSETVATLFAYLLISSSRNSGEADEICTKTIERQAEVENSG
jgi:hypothetical protein